MAPFDIKNALIKLRAALREAVDPALFGDLTYERVALMVEECAQELGFKKFGASASGGTSGGGGG